MNTTSVLSRRAAALTLSLLFAAPLSAQLRVLERARWQGVDYVAGGGWFDQTRNLSIVPSIGELKEWDDGRVARSAPFPSPVQATVCDFSVQPGAGLVWCAQIGTRKYYQGHWKQLAPAGSPNVGTSINLQQMAYDPVRHQAILMVENGVLGYSWSYWSFDGANWASIATPPGVVLNGGMTYDQGRSAVLTMTDAGAFLWNGSTWVAVPSIPGPFYRDRALCYNGHRQTLVAFGGHSSFSDTDDTWEWDGVQWKQRTRQPTWPTPRGGSTLVYDPMRKVVFMFGGDNPSGLLDEVWFFEGTYWWNVGSYLTRPTARDEAMMAEAPSAGAVLFGGFDSAYNLLNDTWVWNGAYWLRHYLTTNPSPRSSGAMTRAGNNRVLLVGGRGSNSATLGDTWILDPSQDWTNTQSIGLSPRMNHAVATDPRTNDRVYLFGGMNGQTWFNDLYWWDNSVSPPAWRQIVSANPPAARDIHCMCIDEKRGRIVVFGGRDAQTYALNDTWEFNLATQTWSQVATTTAPSPRGNAAMYYDSVKERVVLVGGYDPTAGFLSDIWEYDGAAWRKRAPVTQGVSTAENYACCFDHKRGVGVLFGGKPSFSTVASDNTYELVEHSGLTTQAQVHPYELAITGLPNVVYNTPLETSVISPYGLSAVLLDMGVASAPFYTGVTPLFCSTQVLYVSGQVVLNLSGNPGVLHVNLPAVVGGYTISCQAAVIDGSCVNLSDAWYVRVRAQY